MRVGRGLCESKAGIDLFGSSISFIPMCRAHHVLSAHCWGDEGKHRCCGRNQSTRDKQPPWYAVSILLCM